LVDIPEGSLPDVSKEGFVALLEFAEGQLGCERVFLRFSSNRADIGNLRRTFMYLGFVIFPPASLSTVAPDVERFVKHHALMVYVID
jgi:hypothetical protein